jgi:hypothetical protein
VHPVVNAKSCPRWVANTSFHYSRSPVYLLLCISLVLLLCTYNQQARSGSLVCVDVLVFVGFQISLFAYFSSTAIAGCSCCLFFSNIVGYGSSWNRTYFFASITCIAAYFASAGLLRMIMRSKISSSVSGASSRTCFLVVGLLAVLVVFAVASFGLAPCPSVGVLLSSNSYSSFTHLDVPLISSIFFTLFLVCSM